MFGHRYFGGSYFGDAYFGPPVGDDVTAPMEALAVVTVGSYAPNQDAMGLAAYVPSTVGSYVPTITSGGTP